MKMSTVLFDWDTIQEDYAACGWTAKAQPRVKMLWTVESSFRKEPTGPLSGRSAEAPQSALSVSVPLLTGPV
jgi:hypothetical protein